jgi:aspartyl-tRNA(Asn)/glutamyl-tRNA(Gln) amidotransferase subunit A
MSPDDLCYTPAAELAALIRAKQVSPLEVMRTVLARVERLQPRLNCFITVCADRALAEAKAAEDAVMAGRPLRPLHGVPFSAKDLVNTEGVRTTFGSFAFEQNVPKQDAPCIARLRAAGAILFGKTTTPEFGHKPFTEAPLFGRTANAWNQGRTSGGSSGGAAVAVAAGLGPLAVASDGGGSTRIPAACNGVVGIKQSLGLVPHGQAPDAFGNNSYFTPTTRTVLDTGLMLDVMAGAHPLDPHSYGHATTGYAEAARATGDLKGKRIAWFPRLGYPRVAREVHAACASALNVPSTEPIWLVLTQANWNARFRDFADRLGDRFSETLRRQIDGGAPYSAVDLQKAFFQRTEIFNRVQGWFERFDLAMMPTLSRTALAIDHDFFSPITIDNEPADTVRRAWYPFTLPFNLTGHPAITLPVGFGADGLPLGLQIVGPLRNDLGVVRAAALFEAAQPWAGKRPPL